jgi:hypothetical protein
VKQSFTTTCRHDRHKEVLMKNWYLVLVLALTAFATACDQISAPEVRQAESPPPAAVMAAAHIPASGTFTQTGITGMEVRSAGPNTIIEQTSTGSVVGTLSGSYEDELRVVIHPNGSFNAQFTITCQCTVEGKAGTLELVASDRGQMVSETLATFKGRAVITGGSGELSDIRGVLEIEGTVDLATGLSTYTYSGRIH